MKLCHLFTELGVIVPCQVKMMWEQEECDIDGTFLGFTDIYESISRIIPQNFTIIDLGCAFSPQSYYFRCHKKYIGVDLYVRYRFHFPNSEFWIGQIAEFIKTDVFKELDQESTFAICSYVPPWYGDNQKIARDNFKNVFTFYPCMESTKNERRKRRAKAV